MNKKFEVAFHLQTTIEIVFKFGVLLHSRVTWPTSFVHFKLFHYLSGWAAGGQVLDIANFKLTSDSLVEQGLGLRLAISYLANFCEDSLKLG